MRYTCLIVALIITMNQGQVASAGPQHLQIVDNLPGEFIDISLTSGTPLGLLNDGEVVIGTSSVGNQVFPAGSTVVANNGGLAFGNPALIDLAPVNAPLPSNSAFGGGQSTLAFWDDIDDKNGDVFFAFFADRTIVQWNNRGVAFSGDTVKFQIQIFDQSAVGPDNIVAQYLYADVQQPRPGGGAGATIGYQDGGAGFGDFQWSFDSPGAVGDGTVLSLVLTPEPGTLTLMLLGGFGLCHRRKYLIG